MTKHTPGPWETNDKRPQCNGIGIFSGSQFLAFVGDSDSQTPCEANARLIAAAPDLLEALRSITDAADEKRVTAKHYEIARAAIAKATGEME